MGTVERLRSLSILKGRSGDARTGANEVIDELCTPGENPISSV